MRKNQTPWAVIQIGIGIILLVSCFVAFFRATSYDLILQNLFLGAGLLFYGLADNNRDTSEKGRLFTYAGASCLIVGAFLVLYYVFLNPKS